MSGAESRADRLAALERWHSSNLEDARLKMAQLDAIAADTRADIGRIEAGITELHGLARAHATGLSVLDAGALLRMNEFNACQLQLLQSARERHEQAARQAEEVRRNVLRLFEKLSVVQRLIERRRELSHRGQQRRAQKDLDEGALTRAPLPHHELDTSEASRHGC